MAACRRIWTCWCWASASWLKAPIAAPLGSAQHISVLSCSQVYPEGRMSQHLDKMVLGDCILAKGPKGRFTYQRNMKRHIGALVCSEVHEQMWGMQCTPCCIWL